MVLRAARLDRDRLEERLAEPRGPRSLTVPVEAIQGRRIRRPRTRDVAARRSQRPLSRSSSAWIVLTRRGEYRCARSSTRSMLAIDARDRFRPAAQRLVGLSEARPALDVPQPELHGPRERIPSFRRALPQHEHAAERGPRRRLEERQLDGAARARLDLLVATLVRSRGRRVHVRWRMGGALVSESVQARFLTTLSEPVKKSQATRRESGAPRF